MEDYASIDTQGVAVYRDENEGLRSGKLRKRLFVDARALTQSFLEDGGRGLQLFAVQLEPRGADAGRADSGLLLHPLDELHELRHRVHAQQRQEPAVELERFIALAGLRRGRTAEPTPPDRR